MWCWLVLGGCFLFISEAEHQQRLRALDSSIPGGAGDDSGETEASPFEGTYSGEIEMTCAAVVGPAASCTGTLAAVVDAAGTIGEGRGDCQSSAETLSLEISAMDGQIASDDRGSGTLGVADRQVAWSGRALVSGDDRLLEGTFSGEVSTNNGVTFDCEGSFLLDD